LADPGRAPNGITMLVLPWPAVAEDGITRLVLLWPAVAADVITRLVLLWPAVAEDGDTRLVLPWPASAENGKTRRRFPFSELIFHKFPFWEGAWDYLAISFLGNFFGQGIIFKQGYTTNIVSTIDYRRGDLEKMVMVREWRHIKMMKRASSGHDGTAI
jgi:hypothetical protein